MQILINAQSVRHRASVEDINMLDLSSQIRLTHLQELQLSLRDGCFEPRKFSIALPGN